jgi:hypothetical protein
MSEETTKLSMAITPLLKKVFFLLAIVVEANRWLSGRSMKVEVLQIV